MEFPNSTGRMTRLGSFLLLSEKEQQEEAQRAYSRLPQDVQRRLTVDVVRNILVADAEAKDVSDASGSPNEPSRW